MPATPAQSKRWREKHAEEVRAYRKTQKYRRRQNLRRRGYTNKALAQTIYWLIMAVAEKQGNAQFYYQELEKRLSAAFKGR